MREMAGWLDGASVIVLLMVLIGTNIVEPPSGLPIANKSEPVIPSDLVEAYEANGVAAKIRFDGKILLVTGLIDGVELDLTDGSAVSLVSSNRYRSVRAVLAKPSKSVAAGLRKGTSIELRCQRVSEVRGRPMLSECLII